MSRNKFAKWSAWLALIFLLLPLSVKAQTTPLSDLDALRYIASQPDLIAAFGADAAKGRSHYETWGIKEGRKITFEPLNYTASHPDLMAAFGIDEIKAVTHYIQWGFKEGRKTTFNPLNYIASQPDLISAFGADAAKGARHYIQNGYAEKRQITFDPARYMASHPDLIQVFAGDETKAATHYIQWGYKEKRQTTFTDLDALQYVASFTDLIQSIGSDVVTAIRHYVTTGYNAGRRISFDALAYIASHGDLIAAFGTDALAGVKHYLNWGYKEGRQVIFDALGYLSRHTDLQQAFGSDTVAATKHYINWGLKEGRTYAFTVSATTTVGGTVSKTRAYVNPGARETFIFTPNKGYYLDSVSGCNGTLSGQDYMTAPVSAACQISAVFKLLFGDISGTVTAYDSSRPAFVTLVSAKDDSVLESQQVGASGAFKFTNLDGRKDYYVDFEQPGREPTAAVVEFGAQRQVTRNDSSMIEKIGNFFGIASSESVKPFAVSAMIGDKVNFTASSIKGLTENEFNYRWEADGTVSGSEIMSYVPNPTRVEIFSKIATPSNTETAARLSEQYGIVLVSPSSSDPSTDVAWSEEFSDRLWELLSEMPFAQNAMTNSLYSPKRQWPGITRIRLTSLELPEDLAKSSEKYIGGDLRISAAAFANATPSLARIDGKRGIFFSNRLFRVVLRIATEDGTDKNVIQEIFRLRYGLRVATVDSDAMLIKPSYCENKAEYRRDCEPTEWRAFTPDELLYLASIHEEYPRALKDLSGFQKPLVALMRRRDGSKSPLNPQAAALAHISQGFNEFTQAVFTNKNRADLYMNVVHEKSHFIWQNLDPSTRLDWVRLSGWWRNPTVPGSTNSVSGNCEKWKVDSNAWTPPNTKDSDLQTNGVSNVVIGHDGQRLDEALLRNGWGNCANGLGFVSMYASTNPDEDFSDSMAFFLVNPDYLRTTAPKKYEFLRDRLMQGTVYASKIRSDLTFQVYNYYKDYSYPGQVKSLAVNVTGAGNENKKVTITVELFQAECGGNEAGCLTDATAGTGIFRSRHVEPFGSARLSVSFTKVKRGTLRAVFTVPATSPAGFYHVEELSFLNALGIPRRYKLESEDFGFQMYVNNPGEDLIPPKYIAGSLRLRILDRGDPLAAGATSPNNPAFTADTSLTYIAFRVKESNKDFNYCVADLLYEPEDPAQRLERPGFVRTNVTRLETPQADGADYLCEGLYPMYSVRRSGKYIVSSVLMADGSEYWAAALQTIEYFFASNRKDSRLEISPEIAFKSVNSDTVAPSLDINRCLTPSITERCLRISAAPTSTGTSDGETKVSIYYWVREDQAVDTASGVGRVFFFLQDPARKTSFYTGEDAKENITFGAGATGYSPSPESGGEIRTSTGRSFPCISCYRFAFSCPASAPTQCDATTWVQYRAEVLLPKGSLAGTWGLSAFAVCDKVWGCRTYDFTEQFTFRPLSLGDSPTSAGLFPFLVQNALGSGGEGREEKATNVLDIGLGGAAELLGIIERSTSKFAQLSWTNDIHNSVSRNIGAGREAISAINMWPFETQKKKIGDLNAYNSGFASAAIVSKSEDKLTGASYQIRVDGSPVNDAGQVWRLEYLGKNNALYSSRALPPTSRVSWRLLGRSVKELPATVWIRVCSDRIWAVQDGYQLMSHVGDRMLTDVRPGQLSVNSTAEATVITDVRCAFGGAVWIEGYAFGVSEKEPLLRTSSVPATRFGFALDRYGAVTKREVSSAPFDIVGLCSAPANEQQMFCSEAKKAVGW